MRLVIADLPGLPTLGALNRGDVGGDIRSHPAMLMLAGLRGPVIEVIHALDYSYSHGVASVILALFQIVVSCCGIGTYASRGGARQGLSPFAPEL